MNAIPAIVVITGPAGSGKSTVSAALAKRLEKCVHIEADHVKHFVVDGFHPVTSADGNVRWEFAEWQLVGDSIGLLMRKFLDSGRSVIVDGYLDVSAWQAIAAHADCTHKFLLLPHLDVILKRDGQRREDLRMGTMAVAEHHQDFSTNPFYADFVTVDSSEQDSEQTLGAILKIMRGEFA